MLFIEINGVLVNENMHYCLQVQQKNMFVLFYFTLIAISFSLYLYLIHLVTYMAHYIMTLK